MQEPKEEHSLEWTEEAKASWLTKLEFHESKWKRVPIRHDAEISQQALNELNRYLSEYDEFPAFCGEESVMAGEGHLRPKILFVLPSPTYYDYKQQKIFSYDNRNFLSRELATVEIDDKDCHFAYVFPMSLDSTVTLGDFERGLFLPYFRRRIHILRPKVIVCMGNKTKEFIESAFSMHPTINRSVRVDNGNGIDIYNLEIDDLKAKGLHVPHPFCVRQSEDKLSHYVKKWEASLSTIEKICNPIPTSGKTFVDKSGTEKKDATHFLMSRSHASFPAKKKKKKGPPTVPKSPVISNSQKRIAFDFDNKILKEEKTTNIKRWKYCQKDVTHYKPSW